MKFIGEIAEFPSARSDAFTGSERQERSRPAPLGMTGVMGFFQVKFVGRG